MGKLQTQPLPDIILSDVMMPEMDGNELCKLAKGNELTADIPFVMLTARLASEHKKEGLEMVQMSISQSLSIWTCSICVSEIS